MTISSDVKSNITTSLIRTRHVALARNDYCFESCVLDRKVLEYTITQALLSTHWYHRRVSLTGYCCHLRVGK